MKKSVIKQNTCPACFSSLDEKFNFCPACGEPITDLAKELIKEQNVNIELSLLSKLIDFIKDEKDLKLINALIDKLSE